MLKKLEVLEDKYKDLTEKISDPEVISRQNEWKQLMKEHAELEPIVLKFREYKKVKNDLEESKEMLEDPEFRQNEQLRKALEEIKDSYDYIIIDCQPALGLATMNALVASDSVIIPVQCEFFALEGITQLLNSIIMVQSSMNPTLRIEGVLLTMLDGRTIIGLEVIEEVRKYFKDKVFNTIIPRLVRLVEAPSHGKPINEYDPKSKATMAYANLAKEVISRDRN